METKPHQYTVNTVLLGNGRHTCMSNLGGVKQHVLCQLLSMFTCHTCRCNIIGATQLHVHVHVHVG